MAVKDLPPPVSLRQLLDCDPGSGKLFWLPRDERWFADGVRAASWNAKHAGKEAFTSTDQSGYRQGRVLGKNCRAHKIVWAMCNGEYPAGQIDHINGNPSDNRIENLRDVDGVENRRNMKLFATNTSGHPGVRRYRRKWQARITVDYQEIYLGTFDLLDDAVAARRRAERKYGFHLNHGRAGK